MVAQVKGANQLNQVQFVGALIRLSDQMYESGTDGLAQKLDRLCSEHIAGHVYEELQLVQDDFNLTMRSREMGAVLDRHGAKLREIFTAYAAADTTGDGTAVGSAAARAALDTMNVRELAELCEDCAIFDTAFTTMQLLSIFCKVAIPMRMLDWYGWGCQCPQSQCHRPRRRPSAL